MELGTIRKNNYNQLQIAMRFRGVTVAAGSYAVIGSSTIYPGVQSPLILSMTVCENGNSPSGAAILQIDWTGSIVIVSNIAIPSTALLYVSNYNP